MEHYLTYKDEKSDKFWSIKTSGNTFTVTYGKSGTKGQTQTKTFDNEQKCLQEAEKLFSEKLKKGYKSTSTERLVTAGVTANVKTSGTQDYKNQWQKIAEAEDVSKAVYNHLLFLCETAQCKKILKQMCEFVETVTIDKKEDRLFIHFGGDLHFIGLPPHHGGYDTAVPDSHRKVCNYHREITFEGGDAPIVFNGVNEKGELYSNAFDPYDFEDVEVIQENSDTVIAPIDYKQDYIIYHPNLKTKHKEPALCYLSHEGDGLYSPYSKSLGMPGVLLRLIAQDILDVELLEVKAGDDIESEEALKEKGNIIPIERSRKVPFVLKLISKYENKAMIKDEFDEFRSLSTIREHVLAATTKGRSFHFRMENNYAFNIEPEIVFPVYKFIPYAPYAYAQTVEQLAIIDMSGKALNVLLKIPFESDIAYHHKNLLFATNTFEREVLIYDVTNPLQPKHATTINVRPQYGGICVIGSTLYIGTEEGLLLFDISNLPSRNLISTLKPPKEIDLRELMLFDDILVVNSQWFLNVKEPTNPVSLGSLKVSVDLHSVIRIRNYFLIFSEFGEYFVVDAGDLSRLRIVQRQKLLDTSGKPTIKWNVKLATPKDDRVLLVASNSQLGSFELAWLN